MTGGAPFVAAWGLWLAILAVALWVWGGDELAPALLSGAALGWLLIAAYLYARAVDSEAPRTLSRSSMPTVLAVLGLAMTLNGLAFGLWLVLIGAEVTLLGLAGLVLEALDARRAAGEEDAR
jgi:hypothetical protein